MTPNLTDDELCEALSLEVFKELCPHTWKKPSGEPFSVEESITRQAVIRGFKAARRQQEDVEELVKACEEIKKWWDISDVTRIVPQRESPDGPRNDSMAAGAIIQVIYALNRFKEKAPRG